MKKFVKISLMIFCATAALMLTAAAAFFIVTSDAALDRNRLINYGQVIKIYDEDGNRIESSSVDGNKSSVSVTELSKDTKNAFIASEDRKFYSHSGLNYGRMIKAMFKNIASFSFKEGASTISQQLVKNTHLSNDKTLTRKLKEIRLAKQLEKTYSKDEILEMYLNTIYFGHSCYGLQSAARFYFDTDADKLTLAQSATLAGLLSSPNNYSPFRNGEKSLARRNIVLKSMLECGFIGNSAYQEAVGQPLGAVPAGTGDGRCDYVNAALDELDELGMDCYRHLSGCNVYTYMNEKTQKLAESIPSACDRAVIITGKENGVEAYVSDIGNARRQPGSAIKPLLVYAPAIDKKIVHTFTKIDDSAVNYNGYSPENYDKTGHGMVTVAQSVAKSYNIPAVKLLNSLTISEAERYANKMGIKLEEGDRNLSLALGGMKYGLTLQKLCDGYTTFRRGGQYAPSRFIKKITDNEGNVLYSAENREYRVFSQGTASLMNGMLAETAKTGTAKKLKNLPYDVAAKTGTCGDKEGNTDAYAIGYTSGHTVCVWYGDAANKRSEITGGGISCNALKDILAGLYPDTAPPPLDKTSGTTVIEIDREDYEKDGKIVMADAVSPKLCRLKVRCLEDNDKIPLCTKFTHPVIKKPKLIVQNGQISIVLYQTEYYSYLIKCDDRVVYDGRFTQNITHSPDRGSHVYTVTPYYSDGEKKYFGDTTELGTVNISLPQVSPLPPPIVNKDWYL